MLAAHLLSHKLHPVAENFNSSTWKKLFFSLVNHVRDNKCLVATATAFAYGVSVGLEVSNEALGYVILGNNQTIAQNIEPGLIGASYTYIPVSVLHHAAAAAYKKLSANDQTALKHLLNFIHDFITFVLYLTLGAKITNADVSYALSIGAPVVTLICVPIFYAAEKLQEQTALTNNVCLKTVTFSKSSCCLTPSSTNKPEHKNSPTAAANNTKPTPATTVALV